jgi:7,8-dihydropterin-6-yl-methyl-4-(beta-D-ribofuranosyl)aminobenzene 5'-phosphate synthase
MRSPELAPEVIVPAHCTGWKATHTMAARFPESFIQGSVGTTYDLVSTRLGDQPLLSL